MDDNNPINDHMNFIESAGSAVSGINHIKESLEEVGWSSHGAEQAAIMMVHNSMNIQHDREMKKKRSKWT